MYSYRCHIIYSKMFSRHSSFFMRVCYIVKSSVSCSVESIRTLSQTSKKRKVLHSWNFFYIPFFYFFFLSSFPVWQPQTHTYINKFSWVHAITYIITMYTLRIWASYVKDSSNKKKEELLITLYSSFKAKVI